MNNIAIVYIFVFGPFFYSIFESHSLNTLSVLLSYYMTFLLILFTPSFYFLLFVVIINALIFYFKVGLSPVIAIGILLFLIIIASHKSRPYKNTASFDDTKEDICTGYNEFRTELFLMIKNHEK